MRLPALTSAISLCVSVSLRLSQKGSRGKWLDSMFWNEMGFDT